MEITEASRIKPKKVCYPKNFAILTTSKVTNEKEFEITIESLDSIFSSIAQLELAKTFYFLDDSLKNFQQSLIKHISERISHKCPHLKIVPLVDNGSIYNAVNRAWSEICEGYTMVMHSDMAMIQSLSLKTALKAFERYPKVYQIGLGVKGTFGYGDRVVKEAYRRLHSHFADYPDDLMETWYCRDEHGRVQSMTAREYVKRNQLPRNPYGVGVELIPRFIDEANTLWTPNLPTRLLPQLSIADSLVGAPVITRTNVMKKYLPIPEKYKYLEAPYCLETYFRDETNIDYKFYKGYLNLQAFVVVFGEVKRLAQNIHKEYWQAYRERNSQSIVQHNSFLFEAQLWGFRMLHVLLLSGYRRWIWQKLLIRICRRVYKEVRLVVFKLMLEPKVLTRSKMLQSLTPDQKWFYGTEESHEPASPISLDGRIPLQIKKYTLPHIRSRPFVCEITDAELIGPKAIGLTQKGHIILETTTGRMWVLEGASNPFWVLKKDRLPVERKLTTACSLAGEWSYSYGHWLQDYLMQIQGVEYYQKKTGRKPLLIIPENPTPWHTESLKLMGYGPDDYIEWNIKRAKVKQLIVCSNGHYEEKHPNDYVAAQPLRWVRERIFSNLPKGGDEVKYSEKIFISRRNAPRRRILNEDEIMGILGPMGYSLYVPDEMSFSEQVKLFSQAKVIIGGHGSGIMNIIFSQKAFLIELFVDTHIRPDFMQIMNIHGLKYGFLVGKIQNPKNLNYTVDVGDLLRLLEKMRGNPLV